MSCCASKPGSEAKADTRAAPKPPRSPGDAVVKPRSPSSAECGANAVPAETAPEPTDAQREAKLRERFNAVKIAQLELELSEQQEERGAAERQKDLELEKALAEEMQDVDLSKYLSGGGDDGGYEGPSSEQGP